MASPPHQNKLKIHNTTWRCADKSLARPGKKKVTATKLGIYSSHTSRISIHFLAPCSNFCKALKKIQNIVCPTRSQRQKWPLRRTENGDHSIVFSVQGIGGIPTGPDPENRVDDQDIVSPGRTVSSSLQVPGEPGHCRARKDPLLWPSRGWLFPSKYPSIAPAEMSNTPQWYFGPLKNNQWGGCGLDPKKSRREIFQRIFTLEIFGDEVRLYAANPLILALSPGHSDITIFRPWSPIAPDRKSFDLAGRKISNFP